MGIPPYRLRIPKAFVEPLTLAIGTLARERVPGGKLGARPTPDTAIYALIVAASRDYTLLLADRTHLEVDVPRERLVVLHSLLLDSLNHVLHLGARQVEYISLVRDLLNDVEIERAKTLIDLIGEIK